MPAQIDTRTPSGPFSIAWKASLGASVISVACTPNRSMVFAGSVNRLVAAYNALGQQLWVHKLEHEVWAVACTSDGMYSAAGTANKTPSEGTLHIFNQNGDSAGRFVIGAPIWGLAFSKNGRRLAASTWTKEIKLYDLIGADWRLSRTITVESEGMYGVKFLNDADDFAANAYSTGIVIYTGSGDLKERFPCSEVGYNIASSADGLQLFSGARGGKVFSVTGSSQSLIKVPDVSRPICGIATVIDGSLIFTGGFDGYVRAIDRKGVLFWQHDMVGEVWSIACSPTGSRLVAASGDGTVVAIDNRLTADSLSELYAHVDSLERVSEGHDHARYSHSIAFICDLGLYAYALRLMGSALDKGRIQTEMQHGLIEDIFKRCPSDHADYPELCFAMGQIHKHHLRHWEAATMFLRASREAKLRLRAYSEAASSFSSAGHPAAALACFRRAREARLTADDLHIIYTLARSFEDAGADDVARDHLDTILVQDPEYRDVASRLKRFRRNEDTGRIDYTGITVPLLGPDAPSSTIDPKIQHIIAARSAELSVPDEERRIYGSVIEDLYLRKILTPGADDTNVKFNKDSYVKYDYLLPQDDVKKKLEAINLVRLSRNISPLAKTLDVGTATGRYPNIFQELGAEAHGIDIEEDAIAYAKEKFAGETCPHFIAGDICDAPFENDQFDLISCMMGTYFHIQRDRQKLAAAQMFRICRPGGMVAISTWDFECPHLTFLSMYSEKDKENLVRNALSIDELNAQLGEVGFVGVAAVRLALVPDTISYDLGVEALDIDGLKRMLEIDVATRATMPNKHGEMFIAYGFKPNTPKPT